MPTAVKLADGTIVSFVGWQDFATSESCIVGCGFEARTLRSGQMPVGSELIIQRLKVDTALPYPERGQLSVVLVASLSTVADISVAALDHEVPVHYTVKDSDGKEHVAVVQRPPALLVPVHIGGQELYEIELRARASKQFKPLRPYNVTVTWIGLMSRPIEG